MPARLHFSNSLDILADRLIENLAREGGDPFRAPGIATPSAAARDWLKVRLAEKTGIAVNIAFLPLENLLWDRLAERDRLRFVADRKPARRLEGDAFQGLVLAQLRANAAGALRAYLGGREEGDDGDDVARDSARRLCQLSGRLAALFREYEYNRVAEHGFPGVAESWMRGEACFEPRMRAGRASHEGGRLDARFQEARALEAWQMEIYRALFEPVAGLRDRWGEATKVYRYTLPQYAELALSDPATPPPEAVAPVFHLFGLSQVSPFHRDLIGRLADEERLGAGAARFEIYALNPCAEFWEDALSLRERRARGRRALAAAPVPRERVEATRPDAAERAEGVLREEQDENGLLALFGKPGRETIKLWCQLTDHDFLEDFREPEPGTLLSAVRASMLHRAGPLEARADLDDSLRIRRAPDARAEIEAARAECAALLRKDPALRPEDLAVLAADADAILPLLRAAFSGGAEAPGNVPALIPDVGGAEENPLLRGMRELFAVGAADADRRRVVGFLDNPAALAAAGLEDSRLGPVSAFLEAAGFQQGWEGEGASTARAAGERAMWAFAVDPADAAASPGVRPAETTAGLEREDAARLLEWLEALGEATRPLRDGASRPFAEWGRLLRGLKERFLRPGERDARADFELARFFEDLESWTWPDAPASADAILIRTLFEDRFRDAERAGRASFLRGGVRVGGLSALRGLPFRHVWIVGLSSDFPAAAEAAPLDLRAYRRIPGESDPAARDLYALLETLAATSGSVSLSWPARAPNGAERQPSRALTGLMAWLETDVLRTTEGAAEGTAGNQSARLGFEDMLPPGEAPWPAAARRPVAWAAEPERDAARATDWRRLEEFLANPAAHAAARRFRVNAWEALDVEEEEASAALFLDRRADDALLGPALRAELSAPGSGAEAFARAWDARARGGLLPPPPYDALEETRLRARLAEALQQEAASMRDTLNARNLEFIGTLRLGPQGSERAEPPVLNLPALDATPLAVPLRVGGLFPWFFRNAAHPAGGWAMRVDKGKEFPAYFLRAWADAMPLPESLSFLHGPGCLFVRDPKKNASEAREVPGFDPDVARRLVFDLLADYARALGGDGAFEDMPLARVESVLKDVGYDPFAVGDWPRALFDAKRAFEEAPGARVTPRDKLLRAIDAGVSADAADGVRRRALPYLEWKRALYAKARPDEGEEEA